MIDIGEGGEEDRIAPREIGVRVLEQTICSLAQLDDFVVGQKLPAFEPLWAFEWGCTVVQPDALQIGMTVRTEDRLPWVGRTRQAWCCRRRGHLSRNECCARRNGREGH
ncbi:MAG: hypothetical protein DMF99_20990 [Acidobacteria bacterium]|nr:MAG: hypothetical protein DMF99_20990 [Acidobacteriota bacterium]